MMDDPAGVIRSFPVEISQRPRTGLRSLATLFFLCGFRPATAAKRTLDISLRHAAAVHVLSALIAIISLVAIIAAMEGESVRSALASIGRDFKQDPRTSCLVVLGVISLIEMGFVGLSFVLMPWGAVDEPLRASFSHALRRAWCQSPHVALCIMLIALFVSHMENLNDAWLAANPIDYPQAPNPPPGMQPGTPESDAYDQLMQAYWNEYSRIRAIAHAAKPWYLQGDEPIVVCFGFACALWFLTALLRAVGVRRTALPLPRQPRCDACGYDLTTMSLESRCPECGEPVMASLGPDARPGMPWERRRGFSAWFACTRLAIFDPVRLGRMLRLQSPGTAHRRFLLLHLPIVFLVGAASLPALAVIDKLLRSPLGGPPPMIEIVFVGLAFGICCTIATVLVSLGTAGYCAVLFYIRDKRNLLTGSAQVVCYLMASLILWELFGAATAIGAILLSNDPTFIARVQNRVDPGLLAFLLWFVPNLLCGFIYLRLAYNAVAATRYANR